MSRDIGDRGSSLAHVRGLGYSTIDLDLNVFLPPERADELLAALPPGVKVGPSVKAHLVTDGQERLWWGTTPVDVFFNTTEFHETVARRVRWEPFAGVDVPFIGCVDLAVFKAFFSRTRDWADLESMRDAGTLDVPTVAGVLASYIGPDDKRIVRLLAL